jgi:hypothetical protein
MAKTEKKKREKVVYVDDGRTIADMSGLPSRKKAFSDAAKRSPSPASTWRDKWATYWRSVKYMLLPMLFTLAIIAAAFGLLYLLLSLAI